MARLVRLSVGAWPDWPASLWSPSGQTRPGSTMTGWDKRSSGGAVLWAGWRGWGGGGGEAEEEAESSGLLMCPRPSGLCSPEIGTWSCAGRRG